MMIAFNKNSCPYTRCYLLLPNPTAKKKYFFAQIDIDMQPYFLPTYHHYIFPLDVTILYYHCCCQITSEQGSDNCGQQKIEKAKRKVKKKNLLEKKHDHVFQTFLPILPSKKKSCLFFPHPTLFCF